MRYLVDTNIWIYYLKTAGSAVEARLRRTPASDVAVCSIVWAELLHGARKYGKADERIAKIEQALAPYTSLPFDDVAAQHYADIRHGLETRGEIIGPYDLLIGAIARANRLTLVSNNAEFKRIPELAVEDWSAIG